jgi:putative ABC transport system permease protein
VDLLLDCLRSVRAHAARFTLTSMGIVWGMAMLTYLLATMNGYEEHFARQIAKVGPRVVFLFPGAVTKVLVGNRNARVVKLERKDVTRLTTLHVIERASPNLWAGPRVLRAGGRTKLAYTYGVNEDAALIRGYEIGSGRFLSRGDVDDAATVAFVGAKVAERLFGDATAVGRTIHVDGTPFRVVGVSRKKGAQLLYVGPADDEIVMVPITTAERWLTRSDNVGQAIFAPRTAAESRAALRSAREILGAHLHFSPDDESAVASFDIQDIVHIIDALLLGLRVFLSTASFVTLFVGAVGIMNVMLVMVSERTKEIGLRKAIGASNRQVFAQFLVETLLVTVAAGLIGVAIGAASVEAMAAAIGAGSTLQGPPVLRPSAVAFVFTTLVGVGVAAGILPAARAVRIDPAVSLRGV